MPHVTLIYPSVGRFANTRYVRSWQMQPLAIAALSHLTPANWDRRFFDDRLEEIDYDAPTDLVAISIETFTAKRGYQIAAGFRGRGVPVVLGGYHATFCPDEATEHAEAVCIGEAERVWETILDDALRGELSGRYEVPADRAFTGYDRAIFAGKRYFSIALVETGRGCPFSCTFCSITAFHKQRCRQRPIDDVVREIRNLNTKTVFIVDDNVAGDIPRARRLFQALEPLNIRWVGQASVNAARDPDLLDLMVRSGCAGLLIGFESLNPGALMCIGKQANRNVDYSAALAELRRRGIAVYGTFLLGLPGDTPETARHATRFAIAERIFIAAFNHVVPFPGTPLYDDLQQAGRLVSPKWWLSDDYRFGDAPYDPESTTAEGLRGWCHDARRRFYGIRSILSRAADVRGNCNSPRKTGAFFGLNLLLRREINQKRGLPLGSRRQEC